MTKKQALSLLTLIADLYTLVNAPDLVVTPDQVEAEPDKGNGTGRSKQSQPMTVD